MKLGDYPNDFRSLVHETATYQRATHQEANLFWPHSTSINLARWLPRDTRYVKPLYACTQLLSFLAIWRFSGKPE